MLKIEILKFHDIDVTKEIVEDIIRNSNKIDADYQRRLIAQKDFDDTHVLRVIYELQPGKIYVVTVYPGRRFRYEKD